MRVVVTKEVSISETRLRPPVGDKGSDEINSASSPFIYNQSDHGSGILLKLTREWK